MEVFPPCADVLDVLCETVLKVCPLELNPHLHTIVATVIPFARNIRAAYGKQVKSNDYMVWCINHMIVPEC